MRYKGGKIGLVWWARGVDEGGAFLGVSSLRPSIHPPLIPFSGQCVEWGMFVAGFCYRWRSWFSNGPTSVRTLKQPNTHPYYERVGRLSHVSNRTNTLWVQASAELSTHELIYNTTFYNTRSFGRALTHTAVSSLTFSSVSFWLQDS